MCGVKLSRNPLDTIGATNFAVAEQVLAQLSAGMRIYIFGNVLNRIAVLHRRSSGQRRPFSEE